MANLSLTRNCMELPQCIGVIVHLIISLANKIIKLRVHKICVSTRIMPKAQESATSRQQLHRKVLHWYVAPFRYGTFCGNHIWNWQSSSRCPLSLCVHLAGIDRSFYPFAACPKRTQDHSTVGRALRFCNQEFERPLFSHDQCFLLSCITMWPAIWVLLGWPSNMKDTSCFSGSQTSMEFRPAYHQDHSRSFAYWTFPLFQWKAIP